MVPRGTLSDSGATACPFVALELDRDRRSEQPDYRHRCYAETIPAPRTIAHQERFCLSPEFAGCPIFQDWAVRAAARPVPLPQGQEPGRHIPDPRAPGSPGLGAAGVGGAVGAAGVAAGATAGAVDEPDYTTGLPADAALAEIDQPSLAAEQWPDSMSAPMPAATAGARADQEADEYFASDEQLGAFDATPTAEPAAAYSPSPYSPQARIGEAAQAFGDDDEPALAHGESPAVPPFLVGRAARPPRASKPGEQVSREDVVPSWEIDGRFGAESGSSSGGNGTLRRLLTIVAVIAILGIGIAAVILIPGLLSGSPTPTTRPSVATLPSPSSLAWSSPLATVIAVVPTPTATTGSVTPSPSSAVPTPTPTAQPSPILYRIKAGDSLAKIGRKFGVTVDEILAANPQITDPNHIEVGQVIVIPQPSPTPLPL
jgi:LysM repeat protein